MSLYPLALNIISYCWILFAVIWLVAAFWTKRSAIGKADGDDWVT